MAVPVDSILRPPKEGLNLFSQLCNHLGFTAWSNRAFKASEWSSEKRQEQLINCLAAADPAAARFFTEVKQKSKDERRLPLLAAKDYQVNPKLDMMKKLAGDLDAKWSHADLSDSKKYHALSAEEQEERVRLTSKSLKDAAPGGGSEVEYFGSPPEQDLSASASAHLSEFNVFDDSFRYQHYDGTQSYSSQPFYDRNQYPGEYNDASGSGSPMLIGGVVGASAVAVIILIFCIGLACGIVIYWGFTQKMALNEKKEKEEMSWIDNDNEV
eukprot:482001_1